MSDNEYNAVHARHDILDPDEPQEKRPIVWDFGKNIIREATDEEIERWSKAVTVYSQF